MRRGPHLFQRYSVACRRLFSLAPAPDELALTRLISNLDQSLDFSFVPRKRGHYLKSGRIAGVSLLSRRPVFERWLPRSREPTEETG